MVLSKDHNNRKAEEGIQTSALFQVTTMLTVITTCLTVVVFEMRVQLKQFIVAFKAVYQEEIGKTICIVGLRLLLKTAREIRLDQTLFQTNT